MTEREDEDHYPPPIPVRSVHQCADIKHVQSITSQVLDKRKSDAIKLLSVLSEDKYKSFLIIASEIQKSAELGYHSATVTRKLFYKNAAVLWNLLRDLGFEISPSHSSNPDNERWTISWEDN